jgi:hypothetical protein
MISSLGELFRHEGSGVRRAAVVSDVRGGEYFEELLEVLGQLTHCVQNGQRMTIPCGPVQQYGCLRQPPYRLLPADPAGDRDAKIPHELREPRIRPRSANPADIGERRDAAQYPRRGDRPSLRDDPARRDHFRR